MWSVDIGGAFIAIFILGICIVLALWGCRELIDWLFIDEAIRSAQPIIPELEIVVKDNVIDTVYIYKAP